MSSTPESDSPLPSAAPRVPAGQEIDESDTTIPVGWLDSACLLREEVRRMMKQEQRGQIVERADRATLAARAHVLLTPVVNRYTGSFAIPLPPSAPDLSTSQLGAPRRREAERHVPISPGHSTVFMPGASSFVPSFRATTVNDGSTVRAVTPEPVTRQGLHDIHQLQSPGHRTPQLVRVDGLFSPETATASPTIALQKSPTGLHVRPRTSRPVLTAQADD